MRPKNLPIILCASIALSIAPVRAQVSADPSDSFLDAFSTYQRAEKLEATGNTQGAFSAYKEAARKLQQISSSHPQWNPAIVEYRKKRTSEAIAKVQEKMAKGGISVVPLPEEEILSPGGSSQLQPGGGFEPPDLPTRDDGVFPPPNNFQPGPSIAPEEPMNSSGDPIQAIQNRMNRLQRDLTTALGQLDAERQERERLARESEEAKTAYEKSEQRQKLLQARADNAEAALMKALNEGAKEAELVKQLKAEAEKARKEVEDLEIEREAEAEVRKQLADRLKSTDERLAKLTKERDDATKLSSEAGSRIADAQKLMEAAVKEKELIAEKLSKITTERDDALAQIAKMKEAQKQVDRLINENTELMAKLTEAEKQITQFKADGVEKDKMIVELKKEVGSVQQQLADTQKQSEQYQLQMAELKTQLEASAKELAQNKTDATAGSTERKKMQEENEILRGIVLRQMKEQARRDQTRKLVLDQMSKLEGKSKDLLNRIDYLGQPVVKLSAKERALFKTPQIEISDTEISIAATKPENDQENNEQAAPDAAAQPEIAAGETAPAVTTPAEAPVKEAAAAVPVSAPSAGVSEKAALDLPVVNALEAPMAPSIPAIGGSDELPVKDIPAETKSASASSVPGNLPAELMPLIEEGKDHFERGNYRDAEKTYEKILAKAPTNLYALSNLGVVRFRSGKLKLAEEAFKKAIAVAPEDAFSHCTLGIVYYSQGKFDEAVNELTKALAINPKNATAHNYLGITASQKGWQEAAMKELETATSLDPNYADAHFNLAVVFATQQPPNKENARRYYKRATELGAEPDSSLEALLK